MLFQERTFEEYLAACAAAVAFAASEGERRHNLFFAKVYVDEAAKLALRLAGAKLGIFNTAQTLCRDKAFLKQTAAGSGTIGGCRFHHILSWRLACDARES